MDQKALPWKQLATRIAYQNKWIRVREDRVIRPDGTEGIYGVVMTPPSVHVVALSENDEVWLINQYRYPTQKFSWEVPAGGSEGQDPLEAAKRELREETGLEAAEWEGVGSFQALSGISDETCYAFIAKNLTQTLLHEREEEGISTVKKVSLPELFSMVASGEFDDGQSLTAIFKALLHLGKLKP